MYGKEIEKVLITHEDVRNRLKEVAKKIGDDYKGKDVLFICVLRGAFMFFADLVREISEYDVNAQVDFIAVSSYGEGTVSTGEVKFIKDCSTPIAGKNVIIVEDIVDTGITLNYLKKVFLSREPESLKICEAIALEALKKVGLEDQAYKKPNQLSGGQMQRVAIARALVNNPAIILADEPTGALDTESGKMVMNLLKEVAKDRLVIMVSHNADLAAEYTVQELATALSNTEFFLKDFNKKLGTVKILSREDRRFQAEYTTFRIDSYPVNSGAHTPSDVIFTRDIEKDTLRRDFTVNAIYYSIDTAEYVDYTGGIPDLYKHVLRTTQSPEKVFSEDGLRILRMVRIAAELGFDIDEETLDGAKKSVHLLKDISGERKREEFLKILRADRKYPSDRTKDSEVKALRVLDEIGALEYILPGISAAKGMEQRPDFHVYDVFNHLIETVRYCPPDLRLAGLLHDVGKPLSVQKYGNMHMHAKTGQEIAKKILGRDGLKMSNRDLNKILRLIDTHMYDIDGLTSEKKIRMFVVDNLEIINDIIALKRADAKASQGDASTTSVSAEKINKVYREMLTDGTPLAYSDLKVDGNDLVGTKIPEDKRAWAMRKILEHAVLHEDCRTRESQLQYLRGLNYGSN
ncbi:MAG: hypothetical protein BHV97_02295 [Clostridium sp. CAG:349_48_7]|nr:MAG: hypothetical protein BHV97_02295 [Clostridium sp. CAG:349_48_7]